MKEKATSLYIHIPFCAQKCAYCDFVSFRTDDAFRAAYMTALCKELEIIGEIDAKPGLKTIFVGGGTPSLLSVPEIEKLSQRLNGSFDMRQVVEFSIEANPGTLNQEKLLAWQKAGVNRVSMGVQSMDDQMLKTLGRIHSSATARQSFELLRNTGFDNINLDVMFGLPGQTEENLLQTLDEIIALNPEHISAYSLKIEDGTPFDKLYSKGLIEMPSEEEDREMYHSLVRKLRQAGYRQYEISNFAKPSRACKHNLVYWKGEPYYAAGLAAHGYTKGVRTGNYAEWDKYQAALNAGDLPVESQETISDSEAAFEYIMLGLRLNEGVDLKAYRSKFKEDLLKQYAEVIASQVQQGTLIVESDFLRLSQYGMDIANTVIAEFL